MTRRRAFLACALALAAVPFTADAQQPQRMPRIAYVTYLEPEDFRSEALMQSLRELGYENGRNLTVDVFRASSIGTVADTVAQSVASRPDVNVAVNSPTALAAKAATATIPVVFGGVADPNAI
jgi:putative tryptophan/tyrosine transport system substrate-binding protein